VLILRIGHARHAGPIGQHREDVTRSLTSLAASDAIERDPGAIGREGR
jgi:hypothetical protein